MRGADAGGEATLSWGFSEGSLGGSWPAHALVVGAFTMRQCETWYPCEEYAAFNTQTAITTKLQAWHLGGEDRRELKLSTKFLVEDIHVWI